MLLKNLQTVLEIDRKRDRLIDELKQAKVANFITSEWTGSGVRLSVLMNQDPGPGPSLFDKVRAVVVDDYETRIRAFDDELTMLGVQVD